MGSAGDTCKVENLAGRSGGERSRVPARKRTLEDGRIGSKSGIRERDESFQVYAANVYAGLGYGYDTEPISGIFADYAKAEEELHRIRPGIERIAQSGR
jgi:hypothetical protein